MAVQAKLKSENESGDFDYPTVPDFLEQSRFEVVCLNVPKAAFGTQKCPGLVRMVPVGTNAQI